MIDRKAMKQQAKGLYKRHYALLIVLCAISIFLGTEFTSVVDNAQIWYDTLTGQETRLDGLGMKNAIDVDTELLDDFIEDNAEAGRQEIAARIQELKDSTDASAVLGRSRGVLAAMMNNIHSGRKTLMMGMALHSILLSREAAAIVVILGSFVLNAMVWIFLKNLYCAVIRRAFLEIRVYRTLPLSHLFYLKSVRRWNRAALTLFLQSIYETLWDITIVGGIIKRYSYFLVPFIVAENPDIRPNEAITLSRRMMNGHKWECCKLELSFLGWMALGFVTFGVGEVLWGVPYRMATYAEFYAAMRSAAREAAIPGTERLNDAYLFAPADADSLSAAYADIVRREDIANEDIVVLSPFRQFLSRTFGLWTASLAEKKVFSRQQGLRQQMRIGHLELSGRAYPQRLNPLWHKKAAALTGRVSYLTPMTIWSLIAVFFIFSMVGWVWEVSLAFITEGGFVNRGMLHGPWLPIYGGGVALIAVLLYRLRTNIALEALAVVVLCGFVEYMTSFVTEQALGMRWWDYTGYYLNLNGRICGEGLAVFAVGGMAAIYLILPVIDAAVTRVKPKILIPVCLALLICFAGDLVYSHSHPNMGEGITSFRGEEGMTERQPSPARTTPDMADIPTDEQG